MKMGAAWWGRPRARAPAPHRSTERGLPESSRYPNDENGGGLVGRAGRPGGRPRARAPAPHRSTERGLPELSRYPTLSISRPAAQPPGPASRCRPWRFPSRRPEHGYRVRPGRGRRIRGAGPGASQGRLSARHPLMDFTTPAVVDTDVVSFLFKNHSLAPAEASGSASSSGAGASRAVPLDRPTKPESARRAE